MPPQARLGDKSQVPNDAHCCLTCHHNCVGPSIQGSPNVNVNGKPATRVTDNGKHSGCCGSNTWIAQKGSSTVMINNLAAHRQGDQVQHCGGIGQSIAPCSPNVMTGG